MPYSNNEQFTLTDVYTRYSAELKKTRPKVVDKNETSILWLVHFSRKLYDIQNN